LHDGLCQELTGIELMCQVLEKKLSATAKNESQQVGKIAEHIRTAIAHTRQLARGLSPVELETNGFMSALRELTGNIAKRFAVECHLECPAPVLIHNNIFATHLYRIAQEAINNAIRHGQARHILISLQSVEERTVLTITDDGKGFSNETKKSGGMGLHIMKYRAGVVGATLEVRSGAGGIGTTVECRFKNDL
jgi:signal transduction histidine kinase